MLAMAEEDNLYESYIVLQYRNKAMQRELESFRDGTRYKKLQEDHRRVIAGYIKENRSLRQELADAHAETVRVRDLWFGQCDSDWEKYQKELAKKDKEIQRLKDQNWKLLKESDDKLDSVTQEYEKRQAEKDAVIEALKSEIAHKDALLNRDSTNTNLPTGQTPPGKEKHIPNGRRSTGKLKGGQIGHEKHVLEKPPIEEVNDTEDHKLADDEVCPACGSGNFTFTGEYEEKYEYDVKVDVIKRLHKYWLYSCDDCGEIVRTGIAPNLRAECQYGVGVQALALSLMNTTNAAINKVPTLLEGLTGSEIVPSEGYIAKLQSRAAKALKQFKADLKAKTITLPLLFWDDTVVYADKARICLRFYGNERIAYYVAHKKKDLPGVLEDGILQALTEMTKVMHDHNTLNYNKMFVFLNLECNAHLMRDLQKSFDDTGHTVLIEIKELVTTTIKDRKDLMQKKVSAFEDAYVARFNDRMTELLNIAEKEAQDNDSKYSGPFERALVARIIQYRNNYFAWVEDFSLPTTNNLSERALRGVKTKTKVSGQFASVETANCYADIRSYTETCRRNGINEMDALIRLCSGNPYTVAEILS